MTIDLLDLLIHIHRCTESVPCKGGTIRYFSPWLLRINVLCIVRQYLLSPPIINFLAFAGRRYCYSQVIEESPSAFLELSPEVRKSMQMQAIALCKATGYRCAFVC